MDFDKYVEESKWHGVKYLAYIEPTDKEEIFNLCLSWTEADGKRKEGAISFALDDFRSKNWIVLSWDIADCLVEKLSLNPDAAMTASSLPKRLAADLLGLDEKLNS